MNERDLLMFGAGVGAGVTVLLAVLAWICRDTQTMPELSEPCSNCGPGKSPTINLVNERAFCTECNRRIVCKCELDPTGSTFCTLCLSERARKAYEE